MDNIKEKLVESLFNFLLGMNIHICDRFGERDARDTCAEIADHLISNGVTIQENDGCVYCKDSESVYHHSSEIHDSMDEDVYISGNSIVVDIGCHSYGTVEIKFCPMCGRKLSEPPKGE